MYKYYLSKKFVNLWRSDIYSIAFEITSPNNYGPRIDQSMVKFNLWLDDPRSYGVYEIPVEKAVEWAVKNNNLIVLKAICEDIIREEYTKGPYLIT